MAYCVHCGVKLGEGEPRCPLCGTIPLDPAQPLEPTAPRAYPIRSKEQELRRDKRFWLLLFGLLLLLPALLCLMIDLMANGQQNWSIYPSAVLTLLFFILTLPVAVNRGKAFAALGGSVLGIGIFLYLVYTLNPWSNWYFPIVLPALGLGALMLGGMMLLYRLKRLNKLTFLAAFFSAAAIQCLGVDALCSLSLRGALSFGWSPYAAAPCLFLSLALFFINGNRSVREEVRRRVHF